MKNTEITFLILLIVFLCSCKNAHNNSDNESKLEVKVNESKLQSISENLLVGSWEDTGASALHFTLFANGKAKSDNMQTLLYTQWQLSGDSLVLTIESIGNRTSSTDLFAYKIQKLNANELVLSDDNTTSIYRKLGAANDAAQPFVTNDIAEINQKLMRETQPLSPKQIMKMYYPATVGAEGNESITITQSIANNGNTIVTLIHDNRSDDSVKAEKYIMELKNSEDKWTVISINKNWKCRTGRGNTDWGVELCK